MREFINGLLLFFKITLFLYLIVVGFAGLYALMNYRNPRYYDNMDLLKWDSLKWGAISTVIMFLTLNHIWTFLGWLDKILLPIIGFSLNMRYWLALFMFFALVYGILVAIKNFD